MDIPHFLSHGCVLDPPCMLVASNSDAGNIPFVENKGAVQLECVLLDRQEIVQPNGRKSKAIISHLNISRPFL